MSRKSDLAWARDDFYDLTICELPTNRLLIMMLDKYSHKQQPSTS